MPGFDWSQEIGHPAVDGWITAAFYFAAAVNCWLVSRRLRGESPSGSREPRAWAAIALLFALLGINRQLDLLNAITELGRMLAVSENWYRRRRPLQAALIAVTAAVCAVTMLILLIRTRHAHPATSFALVGATLILGFVLIRAVSLHQIDRLISARFLLPRWNWIIEMGGIAMVLIAGQWRKQANNRLAAGRPRSSI